MENSVRQQVSNSKLNQASVSSQTQILKDIDDADNQSMKKNKIITLIVYILLITLGIYTGFSISKSGGKTKAQTSKVGEIIDTGKVIGSTDSKTFKDSATGTIEKGGMDGEGTHKLIRDGGPSQTAYLLSSVIDLDDFVGKKVTIWGQTMQAEKAPWLMDVGKIEIQ